MNKKAEAFKKYLDEKEIPVFKVDEIADDELHTVVFRSQLEVAGNNLPAVVILDDSLYGMLRVLIAPKAVSEENEKNLLTLLNGYNKRYKSFKHYLDEEGSVILDLCMILQDENVDGDLIYSMFGSILTHLNEGYKEIMQTVWKAN